MSIGIEKIAETDADAQYAFVSDVYEPDPRFRSRMMIVGQNRGVLRVAKATGDVLQVSAELSRMAGAMREAVNRFVETVKAA